MQMKNIQRYVALCCLLALSLSLFSRSYTFRGLSVADGLSDLVVNALYKDSTGFVWIGTGAALERFDGVRIKRYAIAGADEKRKRVNVIAETAGNQLWMGNGTGLWRLDRQNDRLEHIAPGVIGSAVLSLACGADGTLYIGTAQGLFIQRAGRLEKVLPDANVLSAANRITGLQLAGDSLLWMATHDGLHSLRLRDGKVTAWHNVTGDRHACSYENITAIGPVLYLGTMTQGIVCFDTRTCRFDRFVDVGCNVISALSGDGKELLYVGTDGNGVHVVSTSRREIVRSFRHEPGQEGSLRSNSVYSVLVDRDGLMWVGFYQLGLDYTMYQSELFNVYACPPGFDSKDMPVRTIEISEDKKLIGSRDGLYYIDEKHGRFRSFTTPDLRSAMIICSHAFQGKFYIGTYGGGMYVLDPLTLTLRDFDATHTHPFSRGFIFRIQSDADGYLWIGTSDGLYRYKDGKQVAHYTAANSRLPEGNVYEIFFDSTGKGWICTENGVCIWNPATRSLTTDAFPEGFIHKEKIRVVYEDSAHTLYFLPDKGTLFVSDLSMERFRRIDPHTPLEGKDCMFIIEDEEKWLWIGTNNGLYRCDKQGNFVPYDFTDGIPSPMFLNCYPVRTADGDIWFGNSKGLVRLDASRKNLEKRWSYPIAVTDIHVNGRAGKALPRQAGKGVYEVSLDEAGKNISIYVSGFSYTHPDFISYEYMMEGADEGWRVLDGYKGVNYYDLSAGCHCFRIRHVGSPESETLLYVDVPAPFPVAGVLVAVAAAGIAFLLLHRRKRARQLATLPAPPCEDAAGADVLPAPVPEVAPSVAPDGKYKANKVSAEECRQLAGKLEELMRTEKLYNNPNLKIADLAAAMGTSTHMLSYLFNQHLDCNYYDYLNDYRIAEFKRLANTDEYGHYTLTALAELCGFSSRASFFRYFKKATGITPNEYIRSIGKEGEQGLPTVSND